LAHQLGKFVDEASEEEALGEKGGHAFSIALGSQI